MILMKLGEEYKLYSHDSCIATTQESPHKRLSKQNCNEIFNVVDVEKLASTRLSIRFNENSGYHKFVFVEAYKEGFNKAMELNKDKLFTVDDMKKAIAFGWDYEGLTKKEMLERYNFKLEYDNSYAEDTDKFIQSLQQPTEIEVIINSEEKDSEGCLILTKI